MQPGSESVPLGIVIRRIPGTTRWVRWVWRVVAVLPGAADADWREMRREADILEYHAATVPLELWASDIESYETGLAARVPAVYVVLRQNDSEDHGHGIEVVLATVSPDEAQSYMDSGEEIVEQVPMPPAIEGMLREFLGRHRQADPFVKRQRDRQRVDKVEDGRGDPRIRQISDVYRAPRRRGGESIH